MFPRSHLRFRCYSGNVISHLNLRWYQIYIFESKDFLPLTDFLLVSCCGVPFFRSMYVLVYLRIPFRIFQPHDVGSLRIPFLWIVASSHFQLVACVFPFCGSMVVATLSWLRASPFICGFHFCGSMHALVLLRTSFLWIDVCSHMKFVTCGFPFFVARCLFEFICCVGEKPSLLDHDTGDKYQHLAKPTCFLFRFYGLRILRLP